MPSDTMTPPLPISDRTADRLKTVPKQGTTHLWLPQVAGGLQHCLPADKCFAYLRQCCDSFVTHREVPDREIEDAVDFVYSGKGVAKVNFGRKPVAWPDPSPDLIARVLSETTPVFDASQDTKLSATEVLPHLFQPGELVCAGPSKERPMVRPIEETLKDAGELQFIVINPMRGLQALNYQGRPSSRCQNNTGTRRHLVAEFDDPNLTKDKQARLATRLGKLAPLVMVVYSGGKSLHAWFRVDHLSRPDQVRFFCVACLLGADRTRWDVCGWLRMPGGLRVVDGVPSVRQTILHFSPKVANV